MRFWKSTRSVSVSLACCGLLFPSGAIAQQRVLQPSAAIVKSTAQPTQNSQVSDIELAKEQALAAEKAARERVESAEGAAFVPITLKASPVEIELPNGGVVRLPLGVGQAVLVEVIRAVGALRPWKAPKS